jgi:hypothetical protein
MRRPIPPSEACDDHDDDRQYGEAQVLGALRVEIQAGEIERGSSARPESKKRLE